MDSTWRACFIGILLLTAWLGWPAAVHAQKLSLPAETARIGKDRSWWTVQLRMAKERGSRALAGLEATSVDESVPIDEDVLQAARDCYVLIRAARTGMEIYKGDQKYPDPMMDLAMRKITESWNLARTPVNKVSWGLPRHQYLTEAITDLRRSMRLLDQTLILLP